MAVMDKIDDLLREQMSDLSLSLSRYEGSIAVTCGCGRLGGLPMSPSSSIKLDDGTVHMSGYCVQDPTL